MKPRHLTFAGFTREVGMCLLAALVVIVMAIAHANAATSYQGSDYSYDHSQTYITTCDQESDNTKVKSEVDDDNSNANGTTDAAHDVDGNNGICASCNAGWSIHRHKTCEYRAWWPDQCGNWQAA